MTVDRARLVEGLLEMPQEMLPALQGLVAVQPSPPGTWREWLVELWGHVVSAPLAPHHVKFWRWVARIGPGRPRPFIAIWPRGGGKSTSAELAAVFLGSQDRRRYCLYIRATQELADKSVENIGGLLEDPLFEAFYPDHARPQVGKYGSRRGWRRNRLRTAGGFTVDAIGFDTAMRGVKVDEQRPDLIILDDVDDLHDTPAITARKLDSLANSILPAGAPNVAVLGIQNLIIPNGIFAQLARERPPILLDRILSGPVPAVRGLVYEWDPERERYRVLEGEPTWAGQDLSAVEEQINTWGPTAFLREAQHQVEDRPGGMFDHLEFRRVRREEVPDLVRVVVWVDPAVTSTDQSDACGVQVDGIAEDGTIYRLHSWEQRATPEEAIRRAVVLAQVYGSLTVGVETDQGGDTWKSVYLRVVEAMRVDGSLAGKAPRFVHAKAGATGKSKAHRAAQMLVDYEQGRVVHVLGTHEVLERALRRFPAVKPFDLVDAAFWSWNDLRRGGRNVLLMAA